MAITQRSYPAKVRTGVRVEVYSAEPSDESALQKCVLQTRPEPIQIHSKLSLSFYWKAK